VLGVAIGDDEAGHDQSDQRQHGRRDQQQEASAHANVAEDVHHGLSIDPQLSSAPRRRAVIARFYAVAA
jgi:hypothetical protein